MRAVPTRATKTSAPAPTASATQTITMPRVSVPSEPCNENATAPVAVKTTWVAAPIPRSATIDAAAIGIGAPCCASRRARATSPPTCATGKSAFTDSPIQRRRSSVTVAGRAPGAMSKRQLTA